jgi:FKBP-type peptidyl-prolyl cis-trans isomerase
MSAKYIAIAALVIILLGGGIYWYMQNGTPAPTETSQETPVTPQVAGQDAVVGTGATAMPNSVVQVLYVGMLQDGTVFDSSANNNNEPISFTLGEPGIIPGFQIGVNGMKEGGERRISIPPELGYGDQDYKGPDGNVIIPANSTLVFDIKLIKVSAGSTTPATNSTAPTTE